ncbi:MAG: UDP-N-acetylmuramoyl-L-alanine--D-glutamate ligase [Candidatus Gracilibacteria bacterium]
MNLQELKSKKIAILGFGREGKSTLSFLQSIGCENITVLDRVQNAEYRMQDFQNINFITGEHYLDNLEIYDYIFKSPGISPYTNNLLKYKNKLWSQTKLFFELYKGKIITVTQTKGKSTTATLVYELLNNAGYNVKLVGNIGNPVLDEIDLNFSYDFIVYELSSYMLEDLDNHHSFISILGNIFEDHLDWHQGFENYKKAKLNILNNSENSLIGEDLSKEIIELLQNKNYKTFGLNNSYYSHKGNDFYINGKSIDTEINPIIPGEHNLTNICAILGVCNILNIQYETFQKTINSFSGLPHRLQNIGTYKGIIFIDDAISTTPESTIEGIRSFNQNIGTIFLGGSDRGYKFEKLISELENKKIFNIVLFPDSGNRIKLLLDERFKILETKSMQEAVEFAFKNTKEGEICLLSTASPSYSLWKNFEEKGDEFKKKIMSL